MLLKNKWKRETSDGRTIKPFFFKHLANMKGYLNEEKKAYIKHDTTMDYLLQVVNGYRAPKIAESPIPVTDIIHFDDYDPEQVSDKKIRNIITAIREYKAKVEELFSKDTVADIEFNKYELYMMYQSTLIRKLDTKDINKHTLYALIKTLSHPNNADLSNYIITILFNMKCGAAVELIRQSSIPVDMLVEDAEGDITLYGIKYAKNKQKRAT